MKKTVPKRVKLLEVISEDMRKTGIFLIGAGWLGVMVDNDKITDWAGTILIVTGIIIWIVALYFVQLITPNEGTEE